MTQKSNKNSQAVMNPLEGIKAVQELKVIKRDDKNQKLQIEIYINPTFQQIIYDELYKEKAKEAELPGFRKGNVPREVLEPQVYKELTNKLVGVVLQLIVTELNQRISEVLGKDFVIVSNIMVEDVKFKVLEVPMTIRGYVYYAKRPKLPSLEEFKVKKPEVKVTDKEVSRALDEFWNNWKARVDKKTQAKFDKPDDKWVKHLKLPNAKTLSDLKKLLRESIAKQRKAVALREQVEHILHEIIHKMEIKLPKELLKSRVEAAKESLLKQLQQLGVNDLEYYFKANNITAADFEKQVIHQVEDEIKTSLFWQLFALENSIRFVSDKQYKAYLNQAVLAMAMRGQKQIDPTVAAQQAYMFLLQDEFFKRIGAAELIVVKEEFKEETKVGFVKKDKDDLSIKKDDASTSNTASSKILIPEDAKI